MSSPEVKPLIIAMDGPAGAGKSTVARMLAAKLGYRFLDTGAFYRAVTLAGIRLGVAPTDEVRLADIADRADVIVHAGPPVRVMLDGEDVSAEIRRAPVTSAVSTVATLPRVRRAMVRLQRIFAEGGGVVAEGRDIGTVVFPGADLKFFLDADPAVRAARRAAERGESDVAAVEQEIRARDKQDMERAESPLRAAADAIHVDTSGRSLAEVLAILESRVAAEARGAR